jgi:hypothetical protein
MAHVDIVIVRVGMAGSLLPAKRANLVTMQRWWARHPETA